MHRLEVLGVALAALALSSCAAEKPALCSARSDAPGWRAQPEATRWFALLLHGYDGSPQFADRPLHDCSGTPVLWAGESGACEEVWRYGEPLPARALTDEDLVRSKVGPRHWLAWAVVRRFTTGEGLGPVALVEEVNGGLAVRALGTLRAMTRNAQLRLEVAGGVPLLVAEGEACADGRDGPCERSAWVLPRRGDRFLVEPITGPSGACLGPAVFFLNRLRSLKLDNGWSRRYELRTALRFTPDGLVADEQLAVNDVDPRQPTVPPRLFRRAQAERAVRVDAGGLKAEDPSLWHRVAQAAAP